MDINRYRGDGLPPDGNAEEGFPYLADERLVQAVNMAIVLERPLLVKGPPGCGKTRLAASIAHELDLPLHEWYVKSTSRAKDGLYTIDMVRRLQEAELGEPRAKRLAPYITFGPLGEALRSRRQCVVLIDEIDKADIDFPNDLLRELDEKRFTIEELDERELEDEIPSGFQKTYQAEQAPVIVITSNDEKELPDAFLRRCLFHYIEFPDKSQLLEIVRINIPDLDVSARLIEQAADRLRQIRAVGGFRKNPATSELIDWVRVLHHWGVRVEALVQAEQLKDLPYWQVLLKHQQDQQQLARHTKEALA